jgi:hypothetical protein
MDGPWRHPQNVTEVQKGACQETGQLQHGATEGDGRYLGCRCHSGRETLFFLRILAPACLHFIIDPASPESAAFGAMHGGGRTTTPVDAPVAGPPYPRPLLRWARPHRAQTARKSWPRERCARVPSSCLTHLGALPQPLAELHALALDFQGCGSPLPDEPRWANSLGSHGSDGR